MKVHIRWMIYSDMPKVIAIEKESFEFPWLKDEFFRCLCQSDCVGIVAEYEDKVIGFMIYEYELDETRIHVLNFAVHPDWRRHGVGKQMISKLIAKLSTRGFKRIILEVRETNLPAQLFFHDCGFKAVSILRKYYDDTPEDAYIMQYRYKTPPSKIEKTKNLLARIISRLTG